MDTKKGGNYLLEAPEIFLSASEVSGDLQGSHLAQAILKRHPASVLAGSGGDHMRAAGVDVKIEASHLGYVGFQESFRFRSEIRSRLTTVKELLRNNPPDLVVLVDGKRFNRALVPFLKKVGIPFVYYFVPQVWFWRRWRARKIARSACLIIPAFSEEVGIFRKKGGRVTWLGHPLLDTVQVKDDPEEELKKNGLDPSRSTIALMPGSRWQEIERFAPTILSTVKRLSAEYPELQFMMPIGAAHLESRIRCIIEEYDLKGKIILLKKQNYSCLSQCKLALLSSGTATLETALLNVPMVVFYRVHRMSYWAARALVKTNFIAMPNILLGERVLPELVQKDFSTERLFQEAVRLIESRDDREQQRARFSGIPSMLGGKGALDRVAAAVLDECGATDEGDAFEVIAHSVGDQSASASILR